YEIRLTVTDAAGLSASDQVTLLPQCFNAAPVAHDDFAVVAPGGSAEIDVLANDSDADGSLDPGTVQVSSAPTHGATQVNPTSGVITYTHLGTAAENDTFSYTVSDNEGAVSESALVTITVDPCASDAIPPEVFCLEEELSTSTADCQAV